MLLFETQRKTFIIQCMQWHGTERWSMTSYHTKLRRYNQESTTKMQSHVYEERMNQHWKILILNQNEIKQSECIDSK